MALHCTECGFLNNEGANYCQRCGALLAREEGAGGAGGAGGAAAGASPGGGAAAGAAAGGGAGAGAGAGAGGGSGGDPVTATYVIDEETGELVPVELGHLAARGPALVIRAGGGRVGESFALAGERMRIGRRPDSEIFLDDVTVSRDHALLINRGEQWHLDDCGSLNGTYVNRSRIESQRLDDGDEVQIGKYKLTFHAR